MTLNLQKLNKEQKEAILHNKGPLLIVAGAGTGKTTVITQRIVNLIEKQLAKPEEILAVTFTEKAASEMEERVDKMLDFGYLDLWISTFHSFAERVLRDNALDIGLSPDFKILDSTAAWLLARQNLDKFDLNYYKALGNPTKFIQFLISHFSRCKDQEVYPEDYLRYVDELKTRDDAKEDGETERIKEIANAYHTYQQILLKNNALDFGDLINYCLKLFKQRPLILRKYQEKFKYILVDEFQDTNWSQYELIKLLSAPNNNLTVCADDDQCLPGDTLIEIENGNKKIKDLKRGDKVLTALGRGHIGVSRINKIFKNKKQVRMLTIKTHGGYEIEITDNHKMFCYVSTFSKNYHYVYLMRNHDIGWRIGVTNDLITRLRLERSADKILAIRAFKTDAEARYCETLLSIKYGIPTTCFKKRDGIVVKDNLLLNLYKEIDVEKNVQRLAADLNIDLNSYHFCLDAVNRGRKVRIIINLKMCYRKYRSKENVRMKKPLLLNSPIKHLVSLETSDRDTIKKLNKSGLKMTKAKKGMMFRFESYDLIKAGEMAKKIQKITGGTIEPKFNLGLKYEKSEKRWRSHYALIMPAKNLVIGNYIPVKKGRDVVYDEILEIKENIKDITVYDLEIDKTHNFFANGIAVHNSIYKFRGASFSNIVQFVKDYPSVKQISLVQNYRSSQNILDLSYKFIKQNDPDRLEFVNKIDKKLVADRGQEQGIIEHIHAPNLEREVGETFKKILEILKRDEDAQYNDFAILVRANDSAIPFIKALERANLPYQFLASRGLYSKPIILDVISYFKLLDNYHEGTAVYRILSLPFLEIPETDISAITQYCRKRTKSLFEGLQELSLIPDVSAKTRENAVFILDLIKKHSRLAREKTVSEILLAFLEDSGYLKYLVSKNETERIDLLSQFYKKVKTFEEANIDSSLRNFMQEMSFELESGEEGKLEFDPEQGPDMLKVMTIHGAKGLEFKYVFLVNMVDKRFPTIERKDPIELPESLIKDIKPKGDIHLQEERRLCYVAMTRAKKGLYFTSADDYGGQKKKKISRFLMEMGYDEKNQKSKISPPTFPKSGGQENQKYENGITAEKFRAPKFKKKIEPQFLPQHFSYSQLAAFEKCPLQYKFAFILKVPARGKAIFSFGKTMHNTLHEFLRKAWQDNNKKQAGLFTTQKEHTDKLEFVRVLRFEDLLKIYEKNWIDEWYESKKQKDEYYKLGKKIIKEFYENFEKNPPKILSINSQPALETSFNLKVGSSPTNFEEDSGTQKNKPGKSSKLVGDKHTIYGVIDRIDETEDGVVIIDYKTGKSKEKLNFEDKEQLLIYQIAAEEVLHLKPKQLAYYYLEDGEIASFLGSEKEIAEQKAKILEEIEKIKNSEFTPTPGWQCQHCDFKDICDFAQR